MATMAQSRSIGGMGVGATQARRKGSRNKTKESKAVTVRAERPEERSQARARQVPKGVPPPPEEPNLEPPKFGFVENAERMNSRAAMVGFFALLAVEAYFQTGSLNQSLRCHYLFVFFAKGAHSFHCLLRSI